MTRSVRVLQNTVNAGQTRFTGTVSELSPTAEAHVLAIYQNQLWLSAILGSGENATTVWVPLGRAGMVKTHVQTIPIFTWEVTNVFGSTDVAVQAYDVDGYVYSPSIQVEADVITVTHTEAKAGRLVVISTDNLFSGAPDTGIRYEFVTSFAALPASGTAEVIYVARDTGVAYYYDVDAYHAFGTTVEIVNNLTTNDAGKALSAAQGFALKGLVDTKVTIVPGKQLSTEDYTAAEKIKLASVETGAQVNTVTAVAGKTGAVTLVKADVGLGNVDNTTDAAKPVSTAQQAALDLKLNITSVVNNLTAGGTAAPLSAEQGKVLKGLIDTINGVLQSDDGTLNELQEIVNYIKLNRAELDALNIASIAGLQAALDAKLNANDVSVTNAREWTATTVAQAEAETGTATTRRAWTAQRVFQAIAAWWAASVFKTKLDGIEAGAQVNVPTDLAVGTRTSTVVPVTSSTGADINLPAATTSLAGVMAAADKSKLDGIAPGAQVNVATNLAQGTRTATTVPVTSSTGTSATLDVATSAVAGVMSASDKTKLDSVETGAQANVATNLTTTTAASTLTVVSSTGTNAVLPAATTTVAGVLTATDKSKLDGIAAGAQANTVNSVAGKTGAVTLVKADVGLSNVDNTADTAKPVSTAQQTALNLKLNIASIVNNLTTGGTTVPLSAEQGKVLKGLIDTINAVLQSDDGTLNELQEIVNYIKLNRAELDALGISSIAGLQAALDLKVNTNDVRLTDAREWTGSTVAQAEAEAGTATTRRAWTAQRVFQAIAAWWAASAFKTKLDGIQAGAQVNVPTNLTIGRDSLNMIIESSTGNTVNVPASTDSLSGMMTAADKSKLNGIAAGAQVNVATNLAIGTRTTTTVPVTSSTGTTATLPVATTALAGVMSSADKTKLDGIAAGAQVNVPTNLSMMRSAIDVAVVSSTGSTSIIPGSTITHAGVMTGADKLALNTVVTNAAAGTLMDKYSLLLGTSTGAVNLNTAQVWRITDPSATRSIVITNAPAAARSMSVVLQVMTNRATTWPGGIQWADGLAPVLAANWTMIILTYIDGVVYGSVGPSA